MTTSSAGKSNGALELGLGGNSHLEGFLAQGPTRFQSLQTLDARQMDPKG